VCSSDLVAVDRVGLFRGGGDGSGGAEGMGLRDVYRANASLLGRQRSLVAQAPVWASAHAGAKKEWGEISERVIVEQSEEIAQGKLRDRLIRLAADMGLPRPSTRELPAVQVEEGSPLRVIQVRIEVTTADWKIAYQLIDRIESDPRTMVRITDVTLDGPGLPQIEGDLNLSITVQAVAMIAGAGGTGKKAGRSS